MSLYKLPNDIFTLGLDAQEISIYAYLCSLPSSLKTLDGASTISVKQITIGEKCGIRAVQTVAKIIARLQSKGLVELLCRAVKANRYRGTYRYSVRHLPQDSGYFFVDRRIFGMLIPRQILIYLYICKSFSIDKNICWNSYNDLSDLTGMKRELVIRTVNELTALHLIVRMRRKARGNHRMFVDNHYQIVFFRKGQIRKGKEMTRLFSQNNHVGLEKELNHYYCTTLERICQGISGHFHVCRGSPSDYSHF